MGVLWFIQTGGARPDTQQCSRGVCVSDWGWQRRKSTIRLVPAVLQRVGGDLNNQHHCLLWMFTLSSAPLWNTLILQHRQPTYKADRAASEVKLSTAAEWQKKAIYVVSVNYLWLWPSRVCGFLFHLAGCFMNSIPQFSIDLFFS